MLGRSRHHSGRRWEHGHREQRCSTTLSALVVAAIDMSGFREPPQLECEQQRQHHQRCDHGCTKEPFGKSESIYGLISS
jgi:hypothetical protein